MKGNNQIWLTIGQICAFISFYLRGHALANTLWESKFVLDSISLVLYFLLIWKIFLKVLRST